MHELSDFLLQLHSAAREVPLEAFHEHALVLLKRLVPFDSARWGTARHDERGAQLHAPYLFNDSPETLKDYDACREQDAAARWCLAHLDAAANFQLHDLYAKTHNPGLSDYVQRYRHMQGLIVASKAGDHGLYQAISLYGASADKPFDETQRRTLEIVFPHLTEALRTSLAFQMERMRPRRGDTLWSLAICDAAGDFRFVEAGFRDMLSQEWPGRTHSALPMPLTDLIDRRAQTRLLGRATMFVLDVVCDAVFVRARARVPVDGLSRREQEVAKLVIAGLTHKGIAKRLALSPATVRNHLQSIHDRAGVHNKTELVEQFKRAGL